MPANVELHPRHGTSNEDREWPQELLYRGFTPDGTKQEPAPAATPPTVPNSQDQPTYPQSATYHFNREYDARYINGYHLYNSFRRGDAPAIKDRLLCVRMPPSATPTFDSVTRTWKALPLEGMTAMKLAVPYQQRIDGDPLKAVTVACVHTPDTLQQRLNDPSIGEACDFLYTQAFGSPSRDGKPALIPLYELPGLKPNDRATSLDPVFPFDSSVNLGTTTVKGIGQGKVGPAITVAGGDTLGRVSEVNVNINKIT